MLTNGMKTSIEPTPPRVFACESVAIALQRASSHISESKVADQMWGLRRSGEPVRRLPAAALGGDGGDLGATPAIPWGLRGYARDRAAAAVRAAH